MKLKSESSLFDPSILADKMNEFPITKDDLKEKRDIVNSWIEELKSGKLSKSKEESIKPRFLHDFFDKILGFNSNHPTEWNLTPEFKSFVDGTKPDAALGVFQLYEDNVSAKVAAVVEIKDFNTDLDKKINGISPVEQAFGYAPKTKAPWVFVSNFKEIRFYFGLDIHQYQKFELKSLNQDENLKQFIFICHHNALVHPIKARTTQLLELRETNNSKKYKNKRQHIVDELYKTLKEFDGLEFIDPNLLANIYPFNILDDYVWHYENYSLFTLNPEIYSLLTNIEIKNGQVILSPNLKKELKRRKVAKPEDKIHFIFKKLNYSHVFNLASVKDYIAISERNKRPNVYGFSVRHFFRFSKESDEGVYKNITLNPNQSCDCLSCNFRSLDLKRTLKKLKEPDENISLYELGYGNYLVSANGYKNAYQNYTEIVKTWREKKRKPIEAYLAHYNLVTLFNLITSYEEDGQKKLSKNIKSLDLERILWEDLHGLNKEVKIALREIRDNTLPDRVRKKVDEIVNDFQSARKHYDNGGNYSAIGNYTYQLYHQFSLLYTYVNRNFIVADAYTDYQNIISKIFAGLLISYNLEKYPYRLESFDNFILSEATLHIPTQKLADLLKEVQSIDVKSGDFNTFQKRLVNFLNSFVDNGPFEPRLNNLMQEYLLTYDFKEKCGRIFANRFLLLTKINIKSEDWDPSIGRLLINFLKVEDNLYWFHLDKLGKFLEAKGTLLKYEEVVEILKIANSGNKYGYNKYQHLIENCCNTIEKFYLEKKISEKALVQKAIANSLGENDRSNYRELMYLWKVVDEEERKTIKEIFNKSLDKSFRGDVYEDLLRRRIYSPSEKDYFQKYVGFINRAKGKGFMGIDDGHPQFEDFYFYNFALLLHQLNIPSNDSSLEQLTNLSDFDQWILAPEKFNYSNFNPEWLLVIWIESFLPRLKEVNELPNIVKEHLKKSYNSSLAEIYFKFLD